MSEKPPEKSPDEHSDPSSAIPSARPLRIRIAEDGSLRLPEEISERLGWLTGSYLAVTVEGSAVRLERVEVDPFAEALRKPDADAFDKILAQQRQSEEDALRSFDDRIREGDVPEPRPEDRPDFWD